MQRVLIAWIGVTDLNGPLNEVKGDIGPIAQAISSHEYQRVVLLEYFSKPAHQELLPSFLSWLHSRTAAPVEMISAELRSPTDFGRIYSTAREACRRIKASRKSEELSLVFHLSSGSPAMAAVWILLGKTSFPAELIESSREQGVKKAEVPFDIAVEFLPDLLRESDDRLRRQSTADAPSAPEFNDILYRSKVMSRLVQRSRRVALHNVPVLIEGESGTGKELFAKAIHKASPRRKWPLRSVNCGAIPPTLVESTLFGHEKGAFTGANQLRKGVFEEANGGTLFLDELGELPLDAQVKLLRVLQESKVTRVGATTEIEVDVRVIAATNRTLSEEVAAGRFREDLFYRLAVAVLKVPPLRDRDGDLGLLIDELLKKENQEAAKAEIGYNHKKLSVSARNLLLAHSWPGNVRELQLTLRRLAIWSDGSTISIDDVRDSLLAIAHGKSGDLLDQPLGDGFNLQVVLKEVAQHYLGRALDKAAGNKARAAKLVGAPSYQTFSNWLKKYEVQQ